MQVIKWIREILRKPEIPAPPIDSGQVPAEGVHAPFYVAGTRIRFLIDGSMATVQSAFLCINLHDGERRMTLAHVVEYDEGDDDGEHETDVYTAALLLRCSRPVSFPENWQEIVAERTDKREELIELHKIKRLND